MLQSTHYELLDKVRFGKDGDERKEALKALINLEYEAEFDDADLLKLLDDNDAVIQVYAIGAMGRLQTKDCIPALIEKFTESTNTLILNELLNAFQQYDSDDFLDIVISKLKKLYKKPWFFNLRKTVLDSDSDRGFVLNQILIPSLKYIRIAGNPKVGKIVKPFLDHEDANVRWHTLKVFDSIGIEIKSDILQDFIVSDSSPLVRELATIILERQKNRIVTP